MPTFNDPVADAADMREAVRGLARATRSVEDPRAIYSVIGSLSSALVSMAQVLDQLGAAHDHMSASNGPVERSSRASAYQVSWELHRASAMANQIAATVDRAHQMEAAITYDVHLPLAPTPARHQNGLSL